MKPFFDSPEKIARLQFHALEWLGTPFMPNACIKGAGVSCQKLVGAIYSATGFLPKSFEVPEGPMDWSHAHTDSLIGKFMAAQPQFASLPELPVDQIAPGDMIGIRLGGCVHHCGVVLGTDGKFIHCLRGNGTTLSSVRDASYLKRIANVWRPIL